MKVHQMVSRPATKVPQRERGTVKSELLVKLQRGKTNLLEQNLGSLQVHYFPFVFACFAVVTVFRHMGSYSLSLQKKIKLENSLMRPKRR